MQYIAVGSQSSVICPCISGVRQGSVLGPRLFAAYASPTDDVTAAHRMQHHQDADGLMLYLALTASQLGDLSPVPECIDDVTRWFLENASLLNPSKTDAVIFGTQKRLHVTHPALTLLAFKSRFRAPSDCSLGVTLDSTLSFNKHVTEVARSCRYHIRTLRHIRSCLTVDAANQIACAIVGPKLDYCNSLLNATSEHNLDVYCSA
jgi:hypothetical protein